MSRLLAMLEKIVTVGIMAMIVLAPCQYSVEVRGGTFLSPVDPVVWATAAAWGLYLLLSRSVRRVRVPPLLVILFIVAACLSGLRGSDRLAAAKDIFQLVEYFIVAFALFASVVDLRRRRILLYVYLGVASAVLLYGVFHYLSPGVSVSDVRATFGNRNVLGGFISITLPLFFALALYDRSTPRRIWYGVVCLVGVTVTLSGGTAIALVCALGVLALLRGVRVFLPIAAVSLVLWLFVVPELPRENAVALQESIQLYDADNAVALRYTEWQAATYMIEENPLLGVGTGGYQDHINIYYGMLPNPGGIKMAADTQNLYLVIGSSIGLPGLICFAGMLIWAMLSALRRHAAAASIMEKGAAAGAFGGLLAFAINAVWSPLLVRGLGIPLVFLFALAMGPRPDNDAPDSSR